MTEGEESFTHTVGSKGQSLSIRGPLFSDTDFYLQKREGNTAHFMAPSGWTLSFQEGSTSSPVLAVFGYLFTKVNYEKRDCKLLGASA